MINAIKWLKIKKYNYDFFLKPLSLHNRINAINRKVKTILSHNSFPQSLEIGLSYLCRLNCIHCGVHGEVVSAGKELIPSEKEIKKHKFCFPACARRCGVVLRIS